MIPKRIKLSGFLCYREEQEISFDGSSLWMLSGVNGSGKSSVFDAVTYALFGHHRGGSQGATELVTKGENGFSIEFEFTLDGGLYQMRRTLRRRATGTPASTQQINIWRDDKWLPVADTHRRADFDDWVRDHIGLNYETFTSSVLLLQGRAEKLLDSTAKGRAEVLASIVDLERYQRLHERADAQKKEYKGHVETLQFQLAALPEVTEMELLAAANRIELAEEASGQAQAEVERLQALEFQARQWAEVERRLAAAHARRQEAGALLQEAETIQRQLRRLQELREVLPHVQVICQQRREVEQSESRTQELLQQVHDWSEKAEKNDHLLAQVRLQRENLQKRLASDEKQAQDLARQLPELSAALERVKLAEQRREELQRLEGELARLPADVAERVLNAQKIVDELVGLQHALSPLSRLFQQREELRRSLQTLTLAQMEEKSIEARGKELKARHDEIKPHLDSARAGLKICEEKLASEKALWQQANGLCSEFEMLEGSKICRACGQPLTPKHYKEERGRREKERYEAEMRVRQAQDEWQTAREAEQNFGEQFQKNEQELLAAREAFRDSQKLAQQGLKDSERLKSDCERAYQELPEPFRSRVAASPPADWPATTYPAASDVEAAKRTAHNLAAARRDLEQARAGQTRWSNLNAQLGALRQALDDLAATLPRNPQEVRREFVRLDAEQKALAGQLLASREAEKEVQNELDRLHREREAVQQAVAERQGKLQTEEITRRHCQQALISARKALTPDWQQQADHVALAELNHLRAEKEDLEKSDVEARADQLRQVQIELESLKQTVIDLEKEREQFPAEARRQAGAIQVELQQARVSATGRVEELHAARTERNQLESRRQQREQLRAQLGEAEREWNRYKLLSELLGRDRLQRHLVRQAERQIVDYANNVLDRLSSGQLLLRLSGTDDGAADRALELEAYNRATGQSPINVAFLSGSQRFRVAVSLALGIGQYASRQHRPIESVIIDEGFGCLDRQGRQVMIQELQNLRGHLHCILLVSHQEEFADAFATGYRFELADGHTRVTRIQK
ncbi:MAG TPA: SMC family ATPase [Gemmataceae bacterium]|nr:SMC family ATPase [Gemmataceae bacterium]